MGRFFRSSLRTGRIYRSSNYGQFTQSMSPNYKNQWLADGGHRPRQSIDGEKLPHLLRKVAPFATKSRHTFGGTSIKAPLIRRNRETVAPDLV